LKHNKWFVGGEVISSTNGTPFLSKTNDAWKACLLGAKLADGKRLADFLKLKAYWLSCGGSLARI
jgi:hypothetical protein